MFNLEKAKLVGGTVRKEEFELFLRKTRGEYDLVFADPPYKLNGIVQQLASSDTLVKLLLPGGVLVLETAKSDVDFPCHEEINLLTVRKYGDSQLILYRRNNNITNNDI